jgi:hypothetical protein
LTTEIVVEDGRTQSTPRNSSELVGFVGSSRRAVDRAGSVGATRKARLRLVARSCRPSLAATVRSQPPPALGLTDSRASAGNTALSPSIVQLVPRPTTTSGALAVAA